MDNMVYSENDFSSFEHQKFGTFRTLQIGSDIWFIGIDAARGMGSKSPSVSVSTLVTQKYKTTLRISKGGSKYNTSVTMINEPGLYELSMRIRTPQAKQFREWVFEEVLPTIRKTGAYISPEIIQDPVKVNTLVTDLVESKAKLNDDIISEVELRTALEASPDCCTVGTLAKIIKQNGYDVGAKRLFDWLRANEYLSVQPNSYNVPMDWTIKEGLFQINVQKLIAYTTKNPKRSAHVPMITAKGRVHIMEAYIKSYKANHKALLEAKQKERKKKKKKSDTNNIITLRVIEGGRFDIFRKEYRKNHLAETESIK